MYGTQCAMIDRRKAVEERAERLKQARHRAGFSSAVNAAKFFGWNGNTYKAHEAGRNGFDNDAGQLYAKAFKADLAWLMTGKGDALKGDASDQPKDNFLPASNISPSFDIPEISKQRIPVYGVAIGGADGAFQMNGDIIDYVFCPPGLERVPGVYAIYVQGESMEPRFEAGETVWVHPNRPVRPGDDVVVQIKENDCDDPVGFIKRLVKKTTEHLVVKQFNPPKEIEFYMDTVVSCHRVVFAER